MARNKLLSALILAPASLVYGACVGVRNWLFNRGILKSESFDIPVVVVGNIAVGGTGKTPHVEYLVEQMRHSFNVAVLSRGYRRRTSGFVLAGNNSTVDQIGDEPLQIYRKFGRTVSVAVCEKRVKGINRLREERPETSMVILDDAFQHRYVHPTVAVVLTDFSRPAYDDSLLPYGRLREPMGALNRADIVVVTKCPPDVRPMDLRLVRQNLNLYPWQKLFFSTFEYGAPVPVFPDAAPAPLSLASLTEYDNLISFTGIENPRPLLRYLRRHRAKVKVMRYPDHHYFTTSDLENLSKRYQRLKGRQRYIVTTEKDAMRLRGNPDFPDELKSLIYYIPVGVRFLDSSDDVDFGTTVRAIIKKKTIS
ncbi:MAG: tetraacyldisaccharide 4'-kinase [Clostridium sp.]|nr:tetraacyldisaccharide 4'-kinase [Clostridium sp.]